jgi:hypothetical protein
MQGDGDTTRGIRFPTACRTDSKYDIMTIDSLGENTLSIILWNERLGLRQPRKLTFSKVDG